MGTLKGGVVLLDCAAAGATAGANWGASTSITGLVTAVVTAAGTKAVAEVKVTGLGTFAAEVA